MLDAATIHAVARFYPFTLRMQHVRAAGEAATDFAQRRLINRKAVDIGRPRPSAMTGDDFATGDAAETVEAFAGDAGHDTETTAGTAQD